MLDATEIDHDAGIVRFSGVIHCDRWWLWVGFGVARGQHSWSWWWSKRGGDGGSRHFCQFELEVVADDGMTSCLVW